ncbi:MAG: prolyl oligopeptidase [Polaribacter sp.]|jgi:prolyl oligopeptidase
MYKTNYISLLLVLGFFGCKNTPIVEHSSSSKSMTFEQIPVQYPSIYRDSLIKDDYHGISVADPYRWLEDDNAKDTKDWVKAQNTATQKYLNVIPFRKQIKERLEEIWNYERSSAPMKRGDYYYYFKNDGLQDQAVLYRQKDLASVEETVLDPNKLSSDGTSALGNYSFSKDGAKLAYLVSKGGSDWYTAHVLDLATGKKEIDLIEWIKFSGLSWSKDGFYYSRYPEPSEDSALSGQNQFHQTYYHKLGTAQSQDQLIFADRSNPNKGFSTSTTQDERFLSIGIWESTSGNALYIKDLNKNDAEFIPVMEDPNYDFNVIDNIDNKLLILTNYKAPNNRLLIINSDKPAEGYWEELIPETKDVLQSVKILGGNLVATYIDNASSRVDILSLKGKKESTLELPEVGTVEGFSGKRDDQQVYYTFTSFTRPSTVYLLNMDDLSSIPFKAPKINFDADLYETKQVFYKSMDGTKIPMFVTHKKGLEMDGKRPTLIYGYGGFNISILPTFNLTRLNLSSIFLENGGVFAVANIRGGGEFGKDWHQAGTKDKKQNVFNDFIAAAEYLIANNYTSSEKLAAYGRSNGGLLIGATMTQRPDLFQVALPAVGVLDMLRYQNFTIGKAWAGDYGLSSKPKDFDYLYAYSPLHNITITKYPATMVTTGDHDDRVVPAHSHKFISTLQAHQEGEAPTLIRVSTSAGHGAGKPTSMKIEEAADILSFTFYNLKEKISY